ncbi:MAG: patatin-like phospholipase family protein [Myxococcales bacterium]|nr:patatin-like phospholipase family protein [Myxococcales bacterium]
MTRVGNAGVFRARYTNEKLKEALVEEFGDQTLDGLKTKGKNVLVPAFNVTTGRPRIFKTDHSSNLSADGDFKLVDVALASTTAPTFFPVVEVENSRTNTKELFCDGGVAANHPALLGFAEALAELKISAHKIRLLSVSTPRETLADPAAKSETLDRGLTEWGPNLLPSSWTPIQT